MLAAVARSLGHKVYVLDPYFSQISPQQYISFLKQQQFDVIGCTIYTLTLSLAQKLFEYSREALPDAFMVAGGPHPTCLPTNTLNDIPQLDCVVCGEGEQTFAELLTLLSHGTSIDSVKGIVFRNKDNELVVNQPRELIRDLDDLPMPAYDLFPIEDYIPTPNLVRRYPTIPTQISRGCPFKCSFCQYNLSLGKSYRHKSPGKVIEELAYLKERYGIRGIVFRDSTLTLNVPFLIELCEAMIRHKLFLVWMCYSRTDIIDKHSKELLPLMKKAGCWQIGFGCESGNQKSLDLLQKGTSVENNVAAVEKTIQSGIMCSTTWILGVPGETKDDAWNSVRLAKRLGSHVAKFFLPIPYPGTDLERICAADGGLRNDAQYDEYEMYLPDNPVYVNPRIGKNGMIRLIKDAYRHFYTSPVVLYRNIIQLRDRDMIKKFWDFLRLLI